jgi:hypothetical protein
LASTRPRALQVFAGTRALQHLRERGLKPTDVRLIPAAAGGPKGLVLNPLDRFLFGHWLAGSDHAVHLAGASIGAWRMACALLPDPNAALAELAQLYIHQRFNVPTGRWPDAAEVSRVFADLLGRQFGGREQQLLAHPRYRLHVFTSRGRGPLLGREGALRTPLGYAGAFATNLVRRRAMGGWLQRVVFSDVRDPLPLPLHDFASLRVPLSAANLSPALQASGSIPFVLKAVHDIPGAPRGAYWDGGITDYHLHLHYAAMDHGMVLYPHFQRALVPGWLDKGLRHRHHSTAALDNVVVLAPHPDWVRSLPHAKLPDRQDFKAYRRADAQRISVWLQAVAAAQQLADEAADWLAAPTQDALPL